MGSTITEFAHLQIPLEDVVKATDNFHHDNLIGQGGFGPIYKGGLLWSGKLMKIAALRLERKHLEREVEFWTEISVLSDLNHTNLVSIVGFCYEKDEKIIITTYVPKGSLQEHLNSQSLTWTQRLKICVGVARALSYLHYDKGRSYGVIHLNINSSTILLDENWEPKLSGFKVSIKQSINRMDQVVLSEPFGTPGYVDPAISKTRGVTHKSDIYSFGVVLFEILCGRRAYAKNEGNKLLDRLAKRHYENNTLKDIINPDLWTQMSPQSLVKHSKVAYSCLEEERAHRPNMDYIVAELEKALELQLIRENIENNFEHLKIPLSDIKVVTNNFSETCKIMVTTYCNLYIAELDNFDQEHHSSKERMNKEELQKRYNTTIMKRILPRDDEQGEEVFYKEIEMLTTVKHHNIVTLLGFCSEDSEMILVIDNISNGFLANYLENVSNMNIFTWEVRLKICIDVAHALHYLHYEMEDQHVIINRSINSFNIGLDENFGAKISDFGTSIFLPPNQEDEALHLNMLVGSNHYIDPEYNSTCMLKRESDVYSFGVVMFEILCGRLARNPIYKTENEVGLASVARQCFQMGTVEDIIDPILKNQSGEDNFILNRGPNKESLHTFIEIAYKCLAKTQKERPTMKIVITELLKALFFQEDQVQRPDTTDQVVNKLENTWEHQLFHENTQEEQVQWPTTDQVIDKLEKRLELHLMHKVHGMKLEHLKIRLSDIKLATNDFSKSYIIASWDQCTLYRAELNHLGEENHSFVEGKNKDERRKGNKTAVIKRYSSGYDAYGEAEFLTEIEMLSCVKHHNIVSLLGFCVEGSEMIIVTENISNGYIGDYLRNVKDMSILTWEKRLKICIDVAQALNYLHFEIEDQKIIINRNLKSESIGLDENFGAKIFDFGFSVFLPQSQEDEALYPDEALYLNMCAGTPAYRDPEYEDSGKLKRESDVYNFGVVLFEILCGRTAQDPIYLEESDNGLADMARKSFRTGTLENMIDPILKQEMDENKFVLNRGPNKDSLHAFIEIAYQCVAETQNQRPSMKVVVKVLQEALLLQKNKTSPKISLEEIIQATQNFHKDNCIGGGGFGRVYKGNLQSAEGLKTIVAKRLDTRHGQGEHEFLKEIQILLEYKHENVIGLVGYCDEKDENIIVCEYASKGSLDRYLNDASLTWVKRLNICIDVATALNFFHGGRGTQSKVIHRDIKTANILLNHEWKAKLADFGLSLISPINQEIKYVIDDACGTLGYVDPLYRNKGFLTIESDIYSFGVVLFEILCGRSTFAIKEREGQYLPDFIKNKFEEGKHDEVVFKQIREQIEPTSLIIFQEIAYQCLHHEREKRPTTKKVLMQLKKALDFHNMASTMTKFASLKIPLEDIVKATNNFHHDNIIQHGGSGTTYKGQLMRSEKLMEIAAKRFDCKHGEGDIEFLTEISVLSDLKHTNLVSIIGFCDEKNVKIIITTYEANGSLEKYLDSPTLTWKQRLRICKGVAHALRYLHSDEERDYCIIHCNINSSTILLDDNWEAKLSGFEFSIKQSVHDKDQICLFEHINKIGFMDPTIKKTGGVTHKSDIYSFGVVLFETLCGRKAFNQNEANEFLDSLAKYHYENGTLQDIIHPDLSCQMSMQSLFKYSKVAYSCLKEEQAHRPTIDSIVHTLEKALESQLQHKTNGNNLEHLKIRLNDIKLATDDFSKSNRFVVNGWYTLYRAGLNHVDIENPSYVKEKNGGEQPMRHNTVIIKRLLPRDDEEGEGVFFTEIEILTRVKHPNIVNLLGFCVEGAEMILVIDDASNGYLAHYLRNIYDKRILTWEKRLKICVDVARALNHLHYITKVINRDISSFHIGLDENWGAKIVEFNYSVFLPPNQEETVYPNTLAGNNYCIDPEYEKNGYLKRESDVYSFGVVLFEILCGRAAYDIIYRKESGKGLAPLARKSYRMGTLEDMIDPIIKEETGEKSFNLNRGPNKDILHTFIDIAYKCVAETQDQRPTMKVVVKELEKALFFQNMTSTMSKWAPLQIPLEDVVKATNNFHDDNIIRHGIYCTTYKGLLLRSGELMEISARRLEHKQGLGDLEFWTEVSVLSDLKHTNLVSIIGFCDEKDEKIIVTTYQLYGSISSNLSNPSLTWTHRLKICIGVARALSYLHYDEGRDYAIVHRIITSVTVLVDENAEAKLSCFEYSIKQLYKEKAQLCEPIGFMGYIDPAIEKVGGVTHKSDIYSLGVVLFEILCGREAYIENGASMLLAPLAKYHYENKTMQDIILPDLWNQMSPQSLLVFSKAAYSCLEEEPSHRPDIDYIVGELNIALEFS